MKGLYVRAAICMIEATSSAASAAVFSAGMLQATPVRGGAGWIRAASAGTQGMEPIAPAASASASSGVKNQLTVYVVETARLRPASALRNASDSGSVSARKNTHPTITTASV